MKKLSIIIILLVIFCSHAESRGAYKWNILDVTKPHGGGESHLLELNGKFILIDTGLPQYSSKVIARIKQKTNVLHRVFISHCHLDHYGGLVAISNEIKIKNLHYNSIDPSLSDFSCVRKDWGSAVSHVALSGANIIIEKEGNTYRYGSASLSTKYLYSGNSTRINDYSMVQRLRVFNTKVLFTGDLGVHAGAEIAQKITRHDILTTPHHGVTTIAPIEFFRKVKPSVLITSGQPYFIGRPRFQQTQDYIDESGVDHFNVATSGEINVEFNRKGFIVDGKFYSKPPVIAPAISLLVN